VSRTDLLQANHSEFINGNEDDDVNAQALRIVIFNMNPV
jgi:hypothetical protein